MTAKRVSTGVPYSGVRESLGQEVTSPRRSWDEVLSAYTCAVMSMAEAKVMLGGPEGSDTMILSSRRLQKHWCHHLRNKLPSETSVRWTAFPIGLQRFWPHPSDSLGRQVIFQTWCAPKSSWNYSWCHRVPPFPKSLISHIYTAAAVTHSLHNNLIIQSQVLWQWDSVNSPWLRPAQLQPGSGMNWHICTALLKLQNIFTWHFLLEVHIKPRGISFKQQKWQLHSRGSIVTRP